MIVKGTTPTLLFKDQAAAGVGYALTKNGATNQAGVGTPTTGQAVIVGVFYTAVTMTAGEVDTQGPLYVTLFDVGGAELETKQLFVVDTSAFGGLDAAGTRAAVGLAAANLDTQLAAITPMNAAAIRAALGLAAANLDAQLGAMATPLTAAAIRAALGMAAANLDLQLANLGPSGIPAAGIRAALGVSQPNLDAEIQARNDALETLLERFPSPATQVVGARR